jgi:SAM-dependent methyltransferase
LKLSIARLSVVMREGYQVQGRDEGNIAAINRSFYDALWSQAHLARPERFNTWSLVSDLLPTVPARLEIGPGLRPRLPIAGTHFIDISPPVIERLKAGGGLAVAGEIGRLPFHDQTFDLVCAFDVIEHVEDDEQAFREVSRVLKDDGVLIFSVPVNANLWTEFDDWVGHVRRYDLSDLLAMLSVHELALQKSAVFGMKPRNSRLVKYGMSWLKHRRKEAMLWYNWVGMPLALLFQKGLKLVSGLVDATGVDEVILICRRQARATPAP